VGTKLLHYQRDRLFLDELQWEARQPGRGLLSLSLVASRHHGEEAMPGFSG
jgi:hypothetical protein